MWAAGILVVKGNEYKLHLQDDQPATGCQNPGKELPASDEDCNLLLYWSPKASHQLKVISSVTESVPLLMPKPKVFLYLVFHLKFGPSKELQTVKRREMTVIQIGRDPRRLKKIRIPLSTGVRAEKRDVQVLITLKPGI